MMKIDAERTLFRQALDHANVTGRDRRGVGLVKAFRESITVPGEKFMRPVG